MNLPSRVRIGVADYRVLRKKHPKLNGNPALGWQALESQEMCISSSVSDVRQVETFIHEILHALFDHAGLHEQATDHTLIDPLTISLMHFLMENDLAWLNNYFKEAYIERYRRGPASGAERLS
jgi:hypothetical protein